MKTPIVRTPHPLHLLTIWLTALLLSVAPAWSQTTPVGGIARSFTVTNLETNQPIRLADFAGKVLVLDFFAYWCGPCQASSPDLETNVQRYYAARGGNANGVPVQCLAVSIDDSNPTATEAFVRNAGLELAAQDPMTAAGAWLQFNETDGIPLFVIINCVEGSPSHSQWQVLYKSAGYAGAPALRAVIDRVMPAPRVDPPAILVESPDGNRLANSGPAVNLGSVLLGASGTEQTFTIRNTGDQNLTGIAITKDGANAADFTVDTSRTGSIVTGGASTTFKVTFRPGAVGARRAAVHIASNASNTNPFHISLEGTGKTAPEIDVRSSTMTLENGSAEVTFRNTIVDQPGTERTIVIHNLGNAPLTGVSVSLSGLHQTDFRISDAPDSSIAAGQSHTFTLGFIPSANGLRTAKLQIASNDEDENPFEIQLSGTGTGESEPASIIEVRNGTDPLVHGSAVISFGTSTLNATAIERSIVIGNQGNAPLSMLYASLGGTHASDFEISSGPLPILAPGETATLTLLFQPTAYGVRTTNLRITSNDAAQNPFDITLTGNSLDLTSEPDISLTQGKGPSKNLITAKSARNLGSSVIGKRGKVMTFEVTNTGTNTLNKLVAKFMGRNSTDFMIVKNLGKRTLAPGQMTTFSIAMKPKRAGTRKASLHVVSNDKDENPFVVKLVGIGQAP